MKRRASLALTTLAVFVLVLLFYQTPLMHGARDATWHFIVAKTATFFHVGPITLEESVLDQIQQLRAQNTRLSYELSDYNRLKKELGVPSFNDYKSVSAAVLGRPIDTFQTEYVLSKGVAEGITLRAPVVIEGSILIGFISDVSQHTSIVRLLIHPTTNLTVEIMAGQEEGNPPIRGLLIGHQYISLLVTTIPRDTELKNNLPIVTVGGTDLPGGLTVGGVGLVTNKENEPYQQAEVILPYDPDSLQGVTILLHS